MEIRLGLESGLWWLLALLLGELVESTGWAPSLTGMESQRCLCWRRSAEEDSRSNREATAITATRRDAVWLTGALPLALAALVLIALVLALFLMGPKKHIPAELWCIRTDQQLQVLLNRSQTGEVGPEQQAKLNQDSNCAD